MSLKDSFGGMVSQARMGGEVWRCGGRHTLLLWPQVLTALPASCAHGAVWLRVGYTLNRALKRRV